jgi:CubicO group peptidase (beta-lactamase class C family)
MIADLDGLAALLAKQALAWCPGDYHGYHLFTAGWCASELIRRTDPAGRTLGRFLRDEVTTPLGAEFYIGAPVDIPEERFAAIHEFRLSQLFAHLDTMPWGTVLGLALPGSLARRTMLNLEVRTPAQMALPPYRSLELPGANGVGQVRGLARMYAAFATGGTSLGLRTTTLEALEQAACPPRRGIRDRVLKTDMVYSLGFIKPFPGFPFAPLGRAFGAAGTGGSFAFADPDARLGYAYAPNRLGFHQFNDPREVALRGALYRCLEQA